MPDIDKERLRNAVADLAKLRGTDNWDLGDRILRDVIEKVDYNDLKDAVRKNTAEIAESIQKISSSNISYMEVMDDRKSVESQRAEILSNLALAMWVADGMPPAGAPERPEKHEKSGGGVSFMPVKDD